MPALIESEHPKCAHLIRDYVQCHSTQSTVSKIMFDACGGMRAKLDLCFKEEKRIRCINGKAKAVVSFFSFLIFELVSYCRSWKRNNITVIAI